MLLPLVVLMTLRSSATAAFLPRSDTVWQASNFNSLITFGDSYTDENRLNYFALHNGTAPPAGTLLPESNKTASGDKTWPRYVVQYAGSNSAGRWDPKMTLYNYAVSGAVCSNEITPRFLPTIEANYPSVLEYELPAFLNDTKAERINATTPYFTPSLTATGAAYAIWIGTNDLGVNAFITNSQIPRKVLIDYVDCVYNVLDGLYAAGGRVFVLLNTAPLHLAPLYANETLGGDIMTSYWPEKNTTNITQLAETMHEYTSSINAIYKYRTPYESLVAKRYPGASFANFNVNGLMQDMYTHPEDYFNGTNPANVTGFEQHCVLDAEGNRTCDKIDNGTSSDSFLWFDELHPSTQTDRIIAMNFLDVLNGESKYAQYW